jgi:MOFRL family protein
MLASIAREIQAHGNPIKAPCVLLASGETTTQIPDNVAITGHGGPGHELAASFAITAATAPGATAMSIDSEGTDGTTSAAGGITDSTSLARAAGAGVSLHAALRGHAAHEALAAIGDVVVTGNTGTNLCDLNTVHPLSGQLEAVGQFVGAVEIDGRVGDDVGAARNGDPAATEGPNRGRLNGPAGVAGARDALMDEWLPET